MITELPTEITIPCSTEASRHVFETNTRRRSFRKSLPLSHAQSCISMRYDPSKPGGVTVVEPKSAISNDEHDHDDARIDRMEELSDKCNNDECQEDDVSSTGAKSPRRKSKLSSRRRPSHLFSTNSSISMKLTPSEQDRILVADPASGAVSKQSHRTDNQIPVKLPKKSIEEFSEKVNQVEEGDDSSTRVIVRRKIKKNNQKKNHKLVSDAAIPSPSTSSTHSLLSRRPGRDVVNKTLPSVSVDKHDQLSTQSAMSGTKSAVEPFNGYTVEIDDDSQESDTAEKRNSSHSQDSNHVPSKAMHSSICSRLQEEKNECLILSEVDDNPDYNQSPVKETPKSPVVTPSDQVEVCSLHAAGSETTNTQKVRSLNNDTVEARDDEQDYVKGITSDIDSRLLSKNDNCLRKLRTIKSDFELDIRNNRRNDEIEEGCFDYYSLATPSTAPTVSMCSSDSVTHSHDRNKKGFLRRMNPMKIKNRLTKYTSETRSVFSAPERKLPALSELMTRNDRKNQARSFNLIGSEHLEHVTSELTDTESTILPTRSEEQRKEEVSRNDSMEEIFVVSDGSLEISFNEAMQIARNEGATLLSRMQEDQENVIRIDDQKSEISSKSFLIYLGTVGHMISPVVSDVSGTMSEPIAPSFSLEDNYAFKQKLVSEGNSIASHSSRTSRHNETLGELSVPILPSDQRSDSSMSNKRQLSLSQAIPAVLSTEEEDTITTIYDRNILKQPSLVSPENSKKGPKIQSYHSSKEETIDSATIPEAADSSPLVGYYFPSPRFPTFRAIKAPFGLSFGAGDDNAFSGLDRLRSETSRKAELSMLPSDDSESLYGTLEEPALDHKEQKPEDSSFHPFLASFHSLWAQLGF